MPSDKSLDLRVVRLQRACTVGEQRFDSFVIKNAATDPMIRTSRMNTKRDMSILALIATCFSIGGYVVQFIGRKIARRYLKR